jgi:hypothetical protein
MYGVDVELLCCHMASCSIRRRLVARGINSSYQQAVGQVKVSAISAYAWQLMASAGSIICTIATVHCNMRSSSLRQISWCAHCLAGGNIRYVAAAAAAAYAGHAEGASSTADEQQQPLLDHQQQQAAEDDDDLGFCRVFDTLNDGAKYAEDRQVFCCPSL